VSVWSEYLGFGWKLCELRPGTKAPRDPAWQKPGAPFNENALSAGLIHEHSGTCAIDVDNYEKAKRWLEDAAAIDLDELFADPAAVRIESGRVSRGKLLYALPEPLPTKKVAPYEEGGKKYKALELRCIGGQDVLPPSIHPDTGKPYVWAGADPLMGLPPLPAALEALWRAQLTPATTTPPEAPAQASGAELAELLASRDPDCSYDDWIKVGMAVHAATDGQGFYVWDNWSRKGDKYAEPDKTTGLSGSAHLMSHWRSFRAAGGVGLGSLLSGRVASLDEFPVETSDGGLEDEFTGEDDRTMAGVAQKILRTRLVYLTSQEKFWPTPPVPPEYDFDKNLHGAMSIEGVRNIFTRAMPLHQPKKGDAYHSDPVDVWRKTHGARTAYAAGFDPGSAELYKDPNDGLVYVNTYKPYVVEPLTPEPHELEAWDFLVGRLEDRNYREWLMNYFAYILSNPGKRVALAPLLYGAPGTGKTTLLNQVPELLFGAANVKPMSNDILRSTFNDVIANTWFLVMDELKMGKQDRIETSNKIKAWITGATLPIHPKGGKPYKITNRLQIVATSNYDDAVHIENDDRRWAICEMRGPGFTDAECADLYDGFLNTPRAAGVLKYIMEARVRQGKLTGFSPTGRPPNTAARRETAKAALGTWEAKIMELVLSGEPPFNLDVFRPEAAREALIGAGAPNLFRIVSVLKRAGLDITEIKTNDHRLLAWRNGAEWRAAGYAVARKYLETGVRPFAGSDEVPLAIRTMAGDDGDPDDVSDLLGDSPSG